MIDIYKLDLEYQRLRALLLLGKIKNIELRPITESEVKQPKATKKNAS
jgi:hypothetical protein